MRKIKIMLPIIIALLIFIYGVIKVNCNLPSFIKDKSTIKAYCKTEPFDLIIEIKDSPYFFHVNKKVFLGIKDNSINTINKFANTTSNQLCNSAKNVKDKTEQISEAFLGKFFYRKVQ